MTKHYLVTNVPKDGEPIACVIGEDDAVLVRGMLFKEGMYGSMDRILNGWKIAGPSGYITLVRENAYVAA